MIMTASQAFLIRRNNAIDETPVVLMSEQIRREIREACEKFDQSRGIIRKGWGGIQFGKGTRKP